MNNKKQKYIEIHCKKIKTTNNLLKAHSPLQLERGWG